MCLPAKGACQRCQRPLAAKGPPSDEPVPISQKDPSRLLVPAASRPPAGANNGLLSRRRLPSWQGANDVKGSFEAFGTAPITAKDPDRFLTRVRRRVALWLPKGVGTFGRLKGWALPSAVSSQPLVLVFRPFGKRENSSPLVILPLLGFWRGYNIGIRSNT